MTMKKIIFIAVSALTALFASCNMDKFPHGAILESEGVKTMADAEGFRVGIYTPMKSLLGGSRYTIDELRSGMIHATADFGNQNGSFYRWEMMATEPTSESLWYGDYSGIVSINYTIEAYDKLLKDENSGLTASEKALLKDYTAEAHITRAMIYWDLVTKYCVAYDPATAQTQMGLPLQTTYAPTSDVTRYPGRSSLEETYQLIINDLNAALDLSTPGKTNSNYFTKDVVKALLARVQLNMKDWTNAAKNAQEVINSNTYTLASTDAELESLFISDTSNEILFVVAGSALDRPAATGSEFIHDTEKGDGSAADPTYIPSQTLIDLYDAENDMRYPIFFKTKELSMQGVEPTEIEMIWKFAGNPTYQVTAGKLNYTNAGKLRLAEMYLVLAEAAANMGGDGGLSTAQDALNTLRAARIKNYVDETYTAREIMGVIKAEWDREFVGEGFRLLNMKRWGDDLVFGEPQVAEMIYLGTALQSTLNKPITHSRAVWPIPKVEMDVNPQLKGQQNPGY